MKILIIHIYQPQSNYIFTFTISNKNFFFFRRIGRIRIQRCIDGPTTNSTTVRLITSGETNTRLSLPSQSSSLLTNLITARRSNSLNNPTNNPFNC